MADDALACLLEADADALHDLLLLAYDAGWSDAGDGERLPVVDARIAALLESVAVAHQARMARGVAASGVGVPDWLRSLL